METYIKRVLVITILFFIAYAALTARFTPGAYEVKRPVVLSSCGGVMPSHVVAEDIYEKQYWF